MTGGGKPASGSGGSGGVRLLVLKLLSCFDNKVN